MAKPTRREALSRPEASVYHDDRTRGWHSGTSRTVPYDPQALIDSYERLSLLWASLGRWDRAEICAVRTLRFERLLREDKT